MGPEYYYIDPKHSTNAANHHLKNFPHRYKIYFDDYNLILNYKDKSIRSNFFKRMEENIGLINDDWSYSTSPLKTPYFYNKATGKQLHGDFVRKIMHIKMFFKTKYQANKFEELFYNFKVEQKLKS